MVNHLPGMAKALASVPSNIPNKRKKGSSSNSFIGYIQLA